MALHTSNSIDKKIYEGSFLIVALSQLVALPFAGDLPHVWRVIDLFFLPKP